METIEYRLKSKPGKSVKVLEAFADETENLLNIILKLENPKDLTRRAKNLSLFHYLSNRKMVDIATNLANSKPATSESLKLQDEVYLRNSVYYADNIYGDEEKEAKNISLSLMEVIKNL